MVAGVGEEVGIVGVGVRLRTQGGIALGVLLLLTLATRLPLIPEHLYSFDSVNLALALTDFDPSRNQPQPPGYPFFVAESRLVYQFAETPKRTSTFLKILITCVSVALLYLLGSRLFSVWVGLVAAGLFFFNPALWYAGLTSALRLHIAPVSILVAYFCWRASSGEHRYFYAASIALGLGSGFRPDLALFLPPLWLWTAWQCRRKGVFLRATLLLLLAAACWILALVVAYGGLGQMVTAFRDYLMEQSQSVSALSGGPIVAWRRMVGRAVLWNGLGALPWAWTIPVAWLHRSRFANWNRQLTFLTLWFFPPFLFHSLVHIGSSGHALATIPAMCLVGGVCTIAAQEFLVKKWAANPKSVGLVIGLALFGNAVLFLWPYSIPPRKEVTNFRGWDSVRDAIAVGIYETSYARVRYVARTTDLALRQIETLKSIEDKPVLFLWNRDGEPVWRKVTYYYPSDRLYELAGRRTAQPRARLWRGVQIVAAYSGSPHLRMPVPKGGRLIWLVHPDSVSELSQIVPLQGVFPAYYTDLKEDSPKFKWGSFEFVPE
jgi:hypothetical protein